MPGELEAENRLELPQHRRHQRARNEGDRQRHRRRQNEYEDDPNRSASALPFGAMLRHNPGPAHELSLYDASS